MIEFSAAAYMKRRKFTEAIEDCNRTLDIDDGNVKAYVRRGSCYLSTEQYEDAVRDFQKAHDLDPQSRGICTTLLDDLAF